MLHDIWILVQQRDGTIEEATLGLIAEAGRVLEACGEEGRVTAVAIGMQSETALRDLGSHGADRVILVKGRELGRYHGELFAHALRALFEKFKPSCFMAAQSVETADLCARLGAMLETAVVTQAMDFSLSADGKARAMRPRANGYLFEEVRFDCATPPIICFLPSVLIPREPDRKKDPKLLSIDADLSLEDLKTKIADVIEAEPGRQDIEEAEIVVAGGRGVGKGEAFDVIHSLAELLGGAVAGTRPVIDWQTLPFERQIGQTGKTVAPRLIFNIGISGANEYTAGIEKSQLSIAINKDQRARIFRFADLGVVGDAGEILPLLIARLRAARGSGEGGK